MTRRRGISLAVGLFMVLVACGSPGRAQTPGGRGGATGGPSGNGPNSRPLANAGGWAGGGSASLLTNSSVQKELKLTEKQSAQIKHLSDVLTQRDQETLKGVINPDGSFNLEAMANAITQDGGETIKKALMERRSNRPQEVEGAIARILTPRQRSRLAQIALQMEGIRAVARPEVASRLNMSPEQIEEIRMILKEMSAAQGQPWDALNKRLAQIDLDQGDGDDDKQVQQHLEKMRHDSERVRERALREITRVLTRRQRATFDKMLGEPFDLSGLSPGNRPGPAAAPGPRGTAGSSQPASTATDKTADPVEQPRRPERQQRNPPWPKPSAGR
jgi:Spy/CpxP family protein refolding chaperone